MNEQTTSELLNRVQEHCIKISDDNLDWKLALSNEEGEILGRWSNIEPDDLEVVFRDEVEGAVEDCEVDDMDWRLELFVDEELEYIWSRNGEIRE